MAEQFTYVKLEGNESERWKPMPRRAYERYCGLKIDSERENEVMLVCMWVCRPRQVVFRSRIFPPTEDPRKSIMLVHMTWSYWSFKHASNLTSISEWTLLFTSESCSDCGIKLASWIREVLLAGHSAHGKLHRAMPTINPAATYGLGPLKIHLWFVIHLSMINFPVKYSHDSGGYITTLPKVHGYVSLLSALLTAICITFSDKPRWGYALINK